MFRRRRSSSHHQQPLSTSSAQSAQSAASHAFLKSQPSSSSLSSAAAAAALRSLTPTPTPVENVQTKRMIQRRSSVASQSSPSGSLRPASQTALRRANSSSSMSNRTFRDQSPSRPASSSGPVPIPPPLPSIPRAYATSVNRRSASVGPSVRPASPTRRQPFGRGTSVDPEVRVSVSQAPTRDHDMNKVPELQRAGSRNSINFSYPMNSRPNSPTLAPEPLDRRDAAACSSLASHLSSLESKPHAPAPRTLHPQGRGKPKGAVPGSPGRGTQSVGAAVLAAKAAIVPRNDEPATLPSPPRLTGQRDVNARNQTTRHPTYQPHDQPPREPMAQHKPQESVPSQPLPAPESKQLSTRPALIKRPSTVPEDHQGEERAEANAPEEPESRPVGRISPVARPTIRTPTPEKLKEPMHNPVVSSPESASSFSPAHEAQVLRAHQPGNSPGRSTRFSNRLSVIGFAGEHLHKPPPRSVSPAKSAMKNPRISSLSPDGRTGSVLRPGPALSELSDGTSVGSEEGSRLGFRKKSIKVSFDDEAEIVGVAASPPTSPEDVGFDSPPIKPKGKTSWFGINKRKSGVAGSHEFDEVFKPRRELPSFGSIRGNRDSEQQVTVQHDASDTESLASSELNAASDSFSNDHAIGAVLSNAQPKDTNARARPLSPPPSTIVADEKPAEDTESLKGDKATLQGGSQAAQDIQPLPLECGSEKQGETSNGANLAVPGIAVQPATPEIEKGRSSLDWYTIPGGFPRSSLELDATTNKKESKKRSSKEAINESTTGVMHNNESDDGSGESIYSDAEEGLERDQYGSINAIVEKPTSPVSPDQRATAVEGSPATNGNGRNPEKVSILPDIPQTCQIARPMNPAHMISLSPVPESPGSSNERLPFSSPYPPFVGHSNSRISSPRETPRPSTNPETGKRSMSVHAHGRLAHDTNNSNAHGPLSPQSGNIICQPRHRDGYGQVKQRPASWAPDLLKDGISSLSDELQVNGKGPGPQRPMSNGSDSSSSFKRSNRPRTDSPHTMRRTLRGQSSSPLRTASAHRAKSPPANSRPISSGSPNNTLRTTLRSGEPRREKPAFFSTGKVQRARLSKSPGALFTSRFTDSDDEQGIGQRRWNSRFDDSSDDGERVLNNLPPVRGIPRRADTHDGDSTELEDSSDGERPAPTTPGANHQANDLRSSRNPALAAVAKSRGMSEEEMEEFLRQSSGRRGSLLRRFSMKKPKPSSERLNSKSSMGGRKGSVDAGRENLVFDGGRGHIVTTITTNNPKGSPPRRLRRGISKTSIADSWPLRSDRKDASTGAASSAVHPSERPKTADGALRNGSTVSNTDIPVSKEADVNGNNANALDVGFASGRKKRFPRLRKAFGLRS
ncbi:hypothetical protein BDV25DRAFT_159401 [Aspergillus avenaceus]|uniref:Uncharacterized protein n=1 Tax=Aspergillus avenaceus TaxID=36643 RepID=A0A5N6TNM8_ASPAV|nr:hypothetical protein BDV25DRAFT_159401 [Aspergillus avenaceus]